MSETKERVLEVGFPLLQDANNKDHQLGVIGIQPAGDRSPLFLDIDLARYAFMRALFKNYLTEEGVNEYGLLGRLARSGGFSYHDARICLQAGRPVGVVRFSDHNNRIVSERVSVGVAVMLALRHGEGGVPLRLFIVGGPEDWQDYDAESVLRRSVEEKMREEENEKRQGSATPFVRDIIA